MHKSYLSSQSNLTLGKLDSFRYKLYFRKSIQVCTDLVAKNVGNRQTLFLVQSFILNFYSPSIPNFVQVQWATSKTFQQIHKPGNKTYSSLSLRKSEVNSWSTWRQWGILSLNAEESVPPKYRAASFAKQIKFITWCFTFPFTWIPFKILAVSESIIFPLSPKSNAQTGSREANMASCKTSSAVIAETLRLAKL